MYLDKNIAKQAAKDVINKICESKKNEYYNSLIKYFSESFPNVDFNSKQYFREYEKDICDKVLSDAKRNYFIEVYKEVSKSVIQKGSVEYERFKRHVNGKPKYNELQHFIVRDTPKNISAGKLYRSYYYSVTGTEPNNIDCLELDKFQELIMKKEIVKVKDYYSKKFYNH